MHHEVQQARDLGFKGARRRVLRAGSLIALGHVFSQQPFETAEISLLAPQLSRLQEVPGNKLAGASAGQMLPLGLDHNAEQVVRSAKNLGGLGG